MRQWTCTVTVWVLGAGVAVAALGGCTDPSKSLDGFVKEMMPPSPSETARQAFNVYDADLRRRSINLLSNATWGGEAPYVKTYQHFASLTDEDPTVRAAALRALGRHGSASDIPAGLKALKDKNNFVRWEAAMMLQRLHGDEAVDPLIAAMRDDEDPDVRAAAARGLGQYPQPRVLPALIGALNDEDYAVVQQAMESLGLLTGHDLGDGGGRWLTWMEGVDKPFAAQKPYTYMEYIRPPTTLEKMKFWTTPKVAVPQEPRSALAQGGPTPLPTDATVKEPAQTTPSDSPTATPPGETPAPKPYPITKPPTK